MKRALVILAGWGLLFLASPGIVAPDGSLLLAILGVGVVGSALVQRHESANRRTLLIEWAAGGVGATLALWWVYFVAPPALLYVALVLGFYQLLAGFLMRRLRRKLSISTSVALGWLAAEMLRALVIPPLGLGWLLLGHHASHHLWLAGSARVWGVEGLSLVVAALGGVLAQLIVERKVAKTNMALAAVSLTLALAFAALTQPLAMQPGPTALVVQPGLTQQEKFADNFLLDIQQQSLQALAKNQAQSGPEVDFVAWGESMYPLPMAEAEVRATLQAGGNLPAWRQPLSPLDLDRWEQIGIQLQRKPFLERLPFGTHLLTGVEVYDALDGEVQRFVGTALFDRSGRLGRVAKKQHLVPGGETMLGLERFEFVRERVQSSIGYTPDLRPGTETGILELPARDGRTYRIAALACFDNAFSAPAQEAVASGPLDFHVVTSNEAWYQDACEMDQMVAFSRLLAISTGRALLRVTNSGVSLLIGPDGAEISRLRVGEADRSVRGEMLVTIPVPRDPSGGGPPYVRLRGFLRAGSALFLLALLWKCRAPKGPLA